MARVIASLENIDARCNCLAARKASRYLTAAYDQALAPAKLRATQFSILYKLASAGPATIGELALNMAMDRTTLTSNLKPLERESLIEMASGQDRRVKIVAITVEGTSRYHKALPLWKAVQLEFETRYGEKHAASLRNALYDVLESGFSPWSEADAVSL
ncbi:MarR family winged helix-turn-helix transcriptional regulator [Paraburkholderia sp. C35]|uniref:MarR family winged helix-turn-helix transcriptional regulator n=1 Tax=Paraburkholderia sp. C35 TaxID=2126993 RepID=UPI000D69EE3A|nr:MarR family winged helix-turn-helix transcriptional regulator [Paraburkholderia sp. C35]